MFKYKNICVLICAFYFLPSNAFGESVNSKFSNYSLQVASKSLQIIETGMDAIPLNEKVIAKKQLDTVKYWIGETSDCLRILENDIYYFNDIEKLAFQQRVIALVLNISDTTGLPSEKILEKIESLMTTSSNSCLELLLQSFLYMGLALLFNTLMWMGIPIVGLLAEVSAFFILYYAGSFVLCICGGVLC